MEKPNKNYLIEEQGTLVTVTRQLLKDRLQKESFLSFSTAHNFPLYWLIEFNKGRIVNPGASRIQRLYETLTGKKLKV